MTLSVILFALTLISVSLVILFCQWYYRYLRRAVLVQLSFDWQSSIHLLLCITWAGTKINTKTLNILLEELCKDGVIEYRDMVISENDRGLFSTLAPKEYRLKHTIR